MRRMRARVGLAPAVLIYLSGIIGAIAFEFEAAHGWDPGADAVASRLQQCYKQPDYAASVRFEDYMRGMPTRLHLHVVLDAEARNITSQQASQRPQLNATLTVVTALNSERLDILVMQCGSWPGPLVAAMYVPLPQQEDDVSDNPPLVQDRPEHAKLLKAAEAQAMPALRSVSTTRGACQLRILILYEHVSSRFLANLIPINALRNAALLAATTPLVAMIDVDLLISKNLGEQLVTGPPAEVRARQLELLQRCGQGAVVILPAFQTPKNRLLNGYPQGEELQRGVQLVHSLIARNKTALLSAIRRHKLIRFAKQQFSVGHYRTNFPHWFHTNESYAVEFIPQFEPWFIANRLATPFYDVNFRGYGRNKQIQSAHAAMMGTKFWVHPDAYIIHVPHGKSEAQKDHDDNLQRRRARLAKQPAQPGQLGLGPQGLQPTDAPGIGSDKHRRDLLAVLDETTSDSEMMLQGRLHLHRVDKLFKRFVRLMQRSEYQTLLDPASITCLEMMPWWEGTPVLNLSTSQSTQHLVW